MNEEEKNITAAPAETAAAPKRRGRPRKNPLPAETNELPLENTTKPAKAETEVKTEKTPAPAAPAQEVAPAHAESISLIEKVKKYVRKSKKTETPAEPVKTETVEKKPEPQAEEKTAEER